MPKIAFPVEEGFIRLQPSIAAEIGLNAAIVLLYLIFILEGNTKYLEWDAETKSYWLKKSYNNMAADLFPYFKLALSEDKSGQIVQRAVSFEAVKHTVRNVLKYLCEELELIHRKQINEQTFHSCDLMINTAVSEIAQEIMLNEKKAVSAAAVTVTEEKAEHPVDSDGKEILF